MDRAPGIVSILQNDSTAASTLGGFIFVLATTVITYLSKWFIGSLPDTMNPVYFLWMSGIFFLVAVLVSLWRIQQVSAIFENGSEVTAQVLESKVFRTRWTLKLRFFHTGQQQEINFDQLITKKTKSMLDHKEIVLIIDQREPTKILLRDAYL